MHTHTNARMHAPRGANSQRSFLCAPVFNIFTSASSALLGHSKHAVVYQSDCRYLPYSIHFSELMPFFYEKMDKTRKVQKSAIAVWYENGRQRLLDAQSINTDRASLKSNYGSRAVLTSFHPSKKDS